MIIFLSKNANNCKYLPLDLLVLSMPVALGQGRQGHIDGLCGHGALHQEARGSPSAWRFIFSQVTELRHSRCIGSSVRCGRRSPGLADCRVRVCDSPGPAVRVEYLRAISQHEAGGRYHPNSAFFGLCSGASSGSNGYSSC